MIKLAALDKESRHLNGIIDTPKGSRNKFKYDEQLGLFKLSGMLPVGNVFLHEIERFFIAYNKTKGKRFEVLNRRGPERAHDLVLAGMKKFRPAGASKKKRRD